MSRHLADKVTAEELGLVLDSYSLMNVGTYQATALNETGRTVRAHVYLLVTAGGVADLEQAAPSAEIEEIRWVHPDPARDDHSNQAPLNIQHIFPLLTGDDFEDAPVSVAQYRDLEAKVAELQNLVDTLYMQVEFQSRFSYQAVCARAAIKGRNLFALNTALGICRDRIHGAPHIIFGVAAAEETPILTAAVEQPLNTREDLLAIIRVLAPHHAEQILDAYLGAGMDDGTFAGLPVS
ncbi:hypothetical protein [Rothia nasimurium]|uniref:hypothetical protein n=1 Tax=Rothia nasimurium TaxID=85336 RepID=UPI001F2BE6F8|nr:hypothetical protein [Rothia nasimurium]